MAYRVLSLKWRPQVFADVVGQNHVTHTLVNAFKKNRVAQAYLFTGPRGVGKTTTARLLAKALNCLKTPGDQCNSCTNCTEIADGRNMDVLEIDGASNRGIEEIRNLREMIKYSPINSAYKVFIIDEVHMLTTPAFNALLRTLEEPPPHGKFILATTDVHKVPATIISRCQRFDFNRITILTITNRLKDILKEENISMDEEAIKTLARKADGSMRDALSILDQVIAFCGESITYDDIVQVLGLIPHDTYFSFTEALKAKDGNALIRLLQEIRLSGLSVSELTIGLNEHIRNLMVATISGGLDSFDLSQDLKERYVSAASAWDTRDLLRIGSILTELESKVKRASQPHILLEMTCLKLLEMDSSVSLDTLLDLMDSSKGKGKKPHPVIISPEKPVYDAKTQQSVQMKTELHVKDQLPALKKVDSVEEQNTGQKVVGQDKQDDSPTNTTVALTIEDIQSKWPEIIKAVSSKRPSIGTVLEHCLAEKLNGNRLDVALIDRPKFNLDLLERNKKTIGSILEDTFKIPFRLKFILIENERGKQTKTDQDRLTDDKDQSINGDTTVSRIIERFDGEILR